MVQSKMWRWCLPCVMAVMAMPGGAMAGSKPGASPSLLGSGARALGMGGAFIAVADDATAASWNPAGLIQLETAEFSLVGSDTTIQERTHFIGDASGSQRTRSTELNYFSFATPVQIGDSVSAVFSLNHQAMINFNRKVNYNLNLSAISTETNSFSQKGSLSALSPAIAFQFSPSFSFGFTINWWNDRLATRKGWSSEWKTVTTTTLAPLPPSSVTTIESEKFSKISGVNVNLGLLWDVSEMITIGAVYKSPARIHANYDRTQTNDSTFHNNAVLHIPPSWGGGLALRLSDRLTMDMDYYYTDWTKATLTKSKVTKAANGSNNIINETRNVYDTSATVGASKVKATSQYRIGAEYLFINPKSVVPLRGGFFYDPQPSPNGTDKIYGLALGSGYMWGNIALDIAYNYSWGKIDASGFKAGSTINVKRHRIYVSAIVHL